MQNNKHNNWINELSLLLIRRARVMLLFMGALLLSNPIYAEQKTQRFAIAISGGASMGAYEAGLNWGLLHILRTTSGTQSAIGGAYNPVEIGSVAGASAGGINSLLSAMAWCASPEKKNGIKNRINENIFRDVWFLPDVNQLLPSDPRSDVYQEDDALLSRKAILDAATQLQKTWNTPVFRPGCRVPLGVTVTRVEPQELTLGIVKVQNQRFYLPFEFYVGANRKGRFRFNPSEYEDHWDPARILIPRKKNAPRYSIRDEDIIQAVLTSSAFPVAFGRKRLKYCSLKTRRITARAESDESIPEKIDKDWVCPDGYLLQEAVFADGGLFDNLPIGLARILAEEGKKAKNKPLPVAYIYLNPGRVRYDESKKIDGGACASSDPPPACHELDYKFSSESAMLLGALGTARRYELYRELLRDSWSLNLSEIAYGMAVELEEKGSRPRCAGYLDYFSRAVPCAEKIRRLGKLLENSYDHRTVPITGSFSLVKLGQASITDGCEKPTIRASVKIGAVCRINSTRLRNILADALKKTAVRSGLDKKYGTTINRSRTSIYNDRIIRVSSRGAPITGTLIEAFGAFLDRDFREYDYYVGVYDAVVLASTVKCGLHFSLKLQKRDYGKCLSTTATRLTRAIDLNKDPRGRYIFSLLAKKEFADQGLLTFAYQPMPEVDRDMQLIHEGLEKSLQAGRRRPAGAAGLFAVEKEFFNHLGKNGFEPTATADGRKPLLADIMQDPDRWSHELMTRVTGRLVHLEQKAEDIFEAREPDPEKRDKAMTGIMGMTAFVLQTNTYKHPDFAFSPSTSRDDWMWRNIIPYEIAINAVEGDFLLTWQPTWAVGKQTTFGFRGTVGFPRGVLKNTNTTRSRYMSLGMDLTRLTPAGFASSWGITPTYYQRLEAIAPATTNSWGFDVHAGLLKNRLRVAIGLRDINRSSDTLFLSVGVTDIPGLVYWLSR